jgi:hypothetical protein
VLYTAQNSQLVVMSLRPGEDIGEEMHNPGQFIASKKERERQSLMAPSIRSRMIMQSSFLRAPGTTSLTHQMTRK